MNNDDENANALNDTNRNEQNHNMIQNQLTTLGLEESFVPAGKNNKNLSKRQIRNLFSF